MMKFLSPLIIILLSFTIFCTTSPAQRTKSGKDSEVAATYFTVVDLILTGNFAELENLMNDIAAAKELTDDGKRRLEEMYTALLKIDKALLDRWVAGSPESAHPYIVRGKYYLMQAGKAVQKAQADLEKANKLNPENPAAAAAMVAVSMYRGDTIQVMDEWFTKSTNADPFWLEAYQNKLHYLAPSHNDSDEAMRNFAIKCATSAPEGSTVYSVLFDYFEALNPHGQHVATRNEIELNFPPKATEAFLPTIKKFKADFPYSSIPYYYEARFHYLKGESIPAEFILSKILREEPENIQALEARIALYMAWKKWPKARIDINTLLNLKPESPFGLASRESLNKQSEGN